jgi:hypothetical protein
MKPRRTLLAANPFFCHLGETLAVWTNSTKVLRLDNDPFSLHKDTMYRSQWTVRRFNDKNHGTKPSRVGGGGAKDPATKPDITFWILKHLLMLLQSHQPRSDRNRL